MTWRSIQSYERSNLLKSLALALGARNVRGWSQAEETITAKLATFSASETDSFREQIQRGGDPLGESFCQLRPPAQRRDQGATYTPRALSEAMVQWAFDQGLNPIRRVDPGTGSAEFLRVAASKFPKAQLLGIELDPVAAVIARANLSAAGLADRSEILCCDYRAAAIPRIDGKTLFLGNPPYVRHHQLDAAGKSWLTSEAKKLGFGASQLAGLHVHFFLATALKASKGDFGVFVTSAEWLDVNYGKLVRELFLANLGGQGITVMEPTSRVFEDAASTAAITQFIVNFRPATIRMRRSPHITQVGALTGGPMLHRNRLETENRWSHLTRKAVDLRELMDWIQAATT